MITNENIAGIGKYASCLCINQLWQNHPVAVQSTWSGWQWVHNYWWDHRKISRYRFLWISLGFLTIVPRGRSRSWWINQPNRVLKYVSKNQNRNGLARKSKHIR